MRGTIRNMQIAAGSVQVIDDVYVLNGAICLPTFNYTMMETQDACLFNKYWGGETKWGLEPDRIRLKCCGEMRFW